MITFNCKITSWHYFLIFYYNPKKDQKYNLNSDKLLELWGKEAYVITTNDGKAAIVFHSKLSASGLFEEIIHTAQTRKFGYEYCQLPTHELEVEAKLKLLKYAKSYGITDYEKEVIKEDLIWHKSQIKEE